MHMSEDNFTSFCWLQNYRKFYGQGRHNIETQNVEHKLLNKYYMLSNFQVFTSFPLRKR